jgi:hypothetical protein
LLLRCLPAGGAVGLGLVLVAGHLQIELVALLLAVDLVEQPFDLGGRLGW